MLRDHHDVETGLLVEASPTTRDSADDFPELPLGADAFRSPLHTIPVSPPAREGPSRARPVMLALGAVAAAVGLFTLVTTQERAPELSEARDDFVAAKPLPAPADVPEPAAPAETKSSAAAAISAVSLAAVYERPAPAPTKITVSRVRSDKTSASVQRSKRDRRAIARKSAARRARAKAPAAHALPAVPSRSAVLAAMRSVTKPARSCLSPTSQVAKVDITFSGETGKVSSAIVHGVAGAEASCVQRAVRRAKLLPFGKPQLEITFPFRPGS